MHSVNHCNHITIVSLIFVDGRLWDRLWQWPQATELLFYRGRRHRICSMVMMKEIDIIGLYISLSIHSHCFLCDIFFLSMTKSNKMTNDILFCFLLKKKKIYIYMYMYINIKVKKYILILTLWLLLYIIDIISNIAI